MPDSKSSGSKDYDRSNHLTNFLGNTAPHHAEIHQATSRTSVFTSSTKVIFSFLMLLLVNNFDLLFLEWRSSSIVGMPIMPCRIWTGRFLRITTMRSSSLYIVSSTILKSRNNRIARCNKLSRMSRCDASKWFVYIKLYIRKKPIINMPDIIYYRNT